MSNKSNTPNLPQFDMTKVWSDFKFLAVDMQQLSAIASKNYEAMTAANNLAIEGLQTIAKRQAQIVQNAITEAKSIASELAAAGTPEEKILRQVDLIKESYEQCLSNTKELAELCAKSNSEAANVISKRISGSIDELKDATKKAVSKKKAA